VATSPSTPPVARAGHAAERLAVMVMAVMSATLLAWAK
jgi:hypothetical protein